MKIAQQLQQYYLKMTGRLQDFNSELWQKWASMGVIFLACGAMLYQDHASPWPPKKKSCGAQVPSPSHKNRSTPATRSKGSAYLGQYTNMLPGFARYQIPRLVLVFIALALVGIFVYFVKHNNARDYNAQRYNNMMPPS